ncbi:MAG: hypothetical protein LBJ13_04185 [Puniceicoccales bacterium]|jgi:hypothetical protein|nr:hypothetical protein [Puniceicoccales bacterium]
MDGALNQMWEFIKGLFCWENWQLYWGEILENPLQFFPIVITFCIIFFIVRRHKKKYGNLVHIYTTDHGVVFLKKSALKNVVKKICRGVVPQSHTRVRIRSTCCRKINLRVSVACPHNMQSTSNRLQQVITQTLHQEFGMTNLGSICVVVEKIIGPVNAKCCDSNLPNGECKCTQTICNCTQTPDCTE